MKDLMFTYLSIIRCNQPKRCEMFPNTKKRELLDLIKVFFIAINILNVLLSIIEKNIQSQQKVDSSQSRQKHTAIWSQKVESTTNGSK